VSLHHGFCHLTSNGPERVSNTALAGADCDNGALRFAISKLAGSANRLLILASPTPLAQP
jgi:hypothetical protein